MESELKYLNERVNLLEATIDKLQTEMKLQFMVLHERISDQEKNQCFSQNPGQGKDGNRENLDLDIILEAGNQEINTSGPDLSIVKSELTSGRDHCQFTADPDLPDITTGDDLSQSRTDQVTYAAITASPEESEDFEQSSQVPGPIIKMETESDEWANEDSEDDRAPEVNIESSYFNPNNVKAMSMSYPFHEPGQTAGQQINEFHMKITERVFTCDQCGKSFDERGKLNTHKQIHTDVKNFECSTCQKRFKTKGNLRSHFVQVHENRELFACSTCPKEFKNKKNLEYHIRTSHMNERPFPCNYCSYRSAEKSYIRRHVWRRHKEEYANFIKVIM